MALRRSGSSGPEQRVRSTLESRGHAITVRLGVLLATWDADPRSASDRQAVAELLSGVGVRAVPPLADVSHPDDEVTLAIVDSAPQDRARTAIPQVRPEAEARPSSAAPESSAGSLASLLMIGGLIVLGGLSIRWYTGERASEQADGLDTGWDWLGQIDILLAVVALSGLIGGAAVLLRLGLGQSVPRLMLGLAMVGLFLVVYRIVSPPGDAVANVVIEISLGPGPFVCIVGLLAIALGTRLAMPLGDDAVARRD